MKFSHTNRSVVKGDRNLLVLPLIISSQLFFNNVKAEQSANIGIASNYVWRGLTQSQDKIAFSGGLDYENESGFSIGTWASSLSDGSYELDLYAGFSKQINDINIDFGIISYQYPKDDDNFNEVFFNIDYGVIQAGIAYTFASKDNSSAEFSKGDIYGSISSSKSFENGIDLGVTLGHYNFDDFNGDDYSHFNINISKNDFTFAVDKPFGLTNNNDLIASLAWSKSFEL